MSAPTPVTTSSMMPVSGSTYAVTDVSKSPALTQGKSVAVNVSPDATRENSTHEATNDPARAGSAIQCAYRPITRPKIMLSSAPTSGKRGISQTEVDTGSC